MTNGFNHKNLVVEISHSSQYPRAAMLWIGEVENAATHCEQRFQLREQKTLTETSPEITRSADACLKRSGYAQQGTGVGTGVQLLTVEQECLLLEADVRHSEVQNLFSLLNVLVQYIHKFNAGMSGTNVSDPNMHNSPLDVDFESVGCLAQASLGILSVCSLLLGPKRDKTVCSWMCDECNR